MKNILKYSALAILAFMVSGLTGCTNEGLETDQFSGFSVAAIAPNPVMRGGVLRIVGSNLENVKEVKFAGDVTVTDIEVVEKGTHSEIRVTVPVYGPEVGKVSVVDDKGNVRSTRFDLTYTEPITIDSFSPATVLSGDVLTVTGEYLYNVKEVIFADGVYVTEFLSQSRQELTLTVPANAVTGFIILGDVNELEDENTIPNQIYSATKLEVGKPAVTVAAKTTYKSGDVITVTGEHLDMIAAVNLNGAENVEFTVAEDGKSLSFNLPLTATDGNITLVSYAGDSFVAGEIETVTVTGLTVKSKAADGRFKAGTEVSITGDELDLVEKLEFTNAEPEWYLNGKEIVATVPAAAKDGIVTVTLASGKQAFSEAIEVVKPVAKTWVVPEDGAVAGETVIPIFGDDLDLVTSATIGTKKDGFIDCEFALAYDEQGNPHLDVKVPQDAYTGPITLTAASSYDTVTDPITVIYNTNISISFKKKEYGLGSPITITGKNLMQIEQVFIKGKKVTSYSLRADDEMAFAIPDKVGPGVYRLELVLIDGTEMTWPVPFEITAPYTETFIWQGYEDMGSWSNQPYYGAEDAFTQAGIEVGDIVRIYYTPLNDWWQFQIYDGHWGALKLNELDGGQIVSKDNTEAGADYFAFEVTEAVLAQITAIQGWGGALLTQGEGVAITGVALVKFGAAEKETFIFEGYEDMAGWTNQPYFGAEGAFTELGIAVGDHIRIYYKPLAEAWQFQIFGGHWDGMTFPEAGGTNTVSNENTVPGAEYFQFEVTSDNIGILTSVQGWGGSLLTQGENVAITGVSLVQAGATGPTENIIWEGSVSAGAWAAALQALSWGGYDWSTVTPGTKLCAHYTIDDPAGCIRFGNGSWASIPSLAGLAQDGNLPLQDGGHEVELTEDDLKVLVNEGGLVICGAGFTITQVGLK